MPRLLAAALVAVLPGTATAQACPWLGDDVAAQVILATPAPSRAERDPVFANSQGLVDSVTCRFREPGELVGQLAVVVREYVSYDAATAAYQRELAAHASRATPSKIGADPAFFTRDPGSSAASCAVKGKRLVLVSHVLGRRAKEAFRKDPAGAVPPTHELARQVLEKL